VIFPEIIIIGAGVGGAAAALQLSRLGRRVLLVERSLWPREKVCGCCVGAAGVAMLHELDVRIEAALGAVPIEQLRLFAGGQRVTLPIAPGGAISRGFMDSLLVSRACASGAVFRPGCIAKVTSRDHAGAWSVRLKDVAHGGHEQTITAPLVLVADGLGGSSLDDLPGFEPDVEPDGHIGVQMTMPLIANGDTPDRGKSAGIIEMHVGKSGYVGVVRLGDGTDHLAAALSPSAARLAGGIAPAINEILGECGVAWRVPPSVKPRGTPLLTRSRRRVSSGGLLVLGDAACYVEPFTGEGMTWALASAKAACTLAEDFLCHRSAEHQLAEAWQTWHDCELRERFSSCDQIRHLCRESRSVAAAISLLRLPGVGSLAGKLIARRVARPYDCPVSKQSPKKRTREGLQKGWNASVNY